MKNATTKNDIQVVLEEFIGRRKAAVVADEILVALQWESQHMHEDKMFYVHTDENGALVLTTESVAKKHVEEILHMYLEEDDVQECLNDLTEEQVVFGESVNKTKTYALETIKVYGSDSTEYTELLKYKAFTENEIKLKQQIKEAIALGVTEFEVPVCDPSLDENGNLQFVPGAKTAVGLSYNKLKKIAEQNEIRLGTKKEYVLFLGTMILRLIKEGWSPENAWHQVCDNSDELGHYANSIHAKCMLEPTGSRIIAGKCDLANTYKILAEDDEYFWTAGGCYKEFGLDSPIANLCISGEVNCQSLVTTGWFVL